VLKLKLVKGNKVRNEGRAMNEKKSAGERAVDYIKDGMVVGLGTGSTVFYTLKKLGELVQNGLKIKGVSTSKATTHLCQELGIPLISINEVSEIDLTIDGADEISCTFAGIKGGGGALLFEKVVATASKKVIWVVDSSKVSEKLGHFPLPVEVIPFGYTHVIKKLDKRILRPQLRLKDNDPFITDSGNYIIDLHINTIQDEEGLASYLKSITGVVEHGLFIDVVDTVIIGKENESIVKHVKG
jgi:ribose 5-phosphate isomerase A